MKKIAVAGALILTSACVAAPTDATPEAGGGGTCDIARAQPLVGQTATTALGGQALRLTGATGLRWIQPHSAVTMDYRVDRLNIKLDAENRITGFTCG